MNLAIDPWIPVLDTKGSARLVSLQEILCRGTEYRDFAVRPHERVALMRLLLCITHASLDGPSAENWRRVPDILPDAAARYLETWQDSFELFHPQKPFLQIAELSAPDAKAKKASSEKKKAESSEDDEADDGPTTKVAKLDFSLANGNNSTLFDHEGTLPERVVSPERTALLLLTFQNFSLGGLIGSVAWRGQATPRTSNDGPCAVGSTLHAFWRGAHILETLHSNLCHKSLVIHRYSALGENAWGRPVWEQMPASLNDTCSIENTTKTYLGRLVPLSRLVLLHPGGGSMLLGAGPVYPNFNNPKTPFPEEPTVTLVLRGKDKKQAPAILGLRPDRAVWRDLHALLVLRQSESVGGFWAVQNVRAKAENSHDLVVVGMARDQAEVVDTLESVYHLPPAILEDAGRHIYEQGVQQAEHMATQLGLAVGKYRQAVDGGWQGRLKGAGTSKGDLLNLLRQKALTHYWTQAEHHLSLLFDCVRYLGTESFPDMQTQWGKKLFTTAVEAYRLSCAPHTPRQFKAFSLGMGVFFRSNATTEEGGQSEEANP